MIKCTRPVVVRAISRLEELKIISVKRTSGGINVYHLLPLSIEDTGKPGLQGGKCSLQGGQPRLQGGVNHVYQNKNQVNENQNNENQLTSSGSVQMYDKRTGGTMSPECPPLPHGADFAAAWDEWIAYRKESRFAYKSPRSTQAALSTLGELPEAEAIATIKTSIANGWRGLFPAKSTASKSTAKSALDHHVSVVNSIVAKIERGEVVQ